MVIRNLLVNWGGHSLNVMVMFFLSPYVVHKLGDVQYGLWTLLIVITGYMGLLDLGIRASVGRYIVLYLGKGDHTSVDEVVRIGLSFFLLLSLIVLIIGSIFGVMFQNFFPETPQEYVSLIKILLPLLGLNVGLQAVAAIFSSILAAHDRFDLIETVNLSALILRTIGTIVTLELNYDIIGLTLLVLVVAILKLSSYYWFARRIYPHTNGWPLMWSTLRIRELFGYGTAAFISSVAYVIIGQTDLILVGSLIGVAAVTIYAIGSMLIDYSWGFIERISYTFFPPIQRAVARDALKDTQKLYIQVVKVAVVIGTPLYLGFIFFGENFIRLWMGPEYASAANVLLVLSLSRLIYMFSVGAAPLLSATGHIRFNATIAVIEAVLNLTLSIIFVQMFDLGVIGIALGTLISMLLVRGVVHPWYACRVIGVSWKKFMYHVVAPGIFSICVFIVLCLIVREGFSASSWWGFWTQVMITILGFLPVVVLSFGEIRQRLMKNKMFYVN